MLDFCIRYVTFLDRLLIDGIKWLTENDDVYYAFMCLIPILGTIITAMRGQLMISFDGHSSVFLHTFSKRDKEKV